MAFVDLQGGVLPLERSGRYIVRLQPELLASVDYRLRIELDAALAFPVSGHGPRNVASVFGDPRDGGRRRHEGIDIFAPRATPVVAVVDGTAVVRHSRLGGTTVWLRGEGKSFYYAHLDEVAIDGRQGVDTGDVLGFVGNTGNAVTAPPHLHFGVYRRGRGAVDPLPYVVARSFAEAPQPVAYEPGFATVTAAGLNLRPGPGTDRTPLDRLLHDAPLRIVAATDDWLRVRTPGGQAGWVHRDYQSAFGEHQAAGMARYRPERATWILSDLRNGVPVGRVRPQSTVQIFAEVPGWRLVGDGAAGPLGWLRAASAMPESIAASP
jgi:SH3-like domain-containing protein